MDDFKNYLLSKKIDSDEFRTADPEQWNAWRKIYEQIHPASFTAQKLYLINPLRRLYPYKGDAPVQEKKEVRKKPVMKPKPQAAKGVEGVKQKPKFKPKVKPKMKSPEKEEDSSGEADKGSKLEKSDKKPRPVIKRPKPESPSTEKEGSSDEAPKSSNGDKPAKKPRPVIKRPKPK